MFPINNVSKTNQETCMVDGFLDMFPGEDGKTR
jgi:hypothetical protein